MTTDACRLMRPGAVASTEHSVVRLLVGTAKLPDLGSPRAGQRDSEENGCPYEGLSRCSATIRNAIWRQLSTFVSVFPQ